MGMTVKRAADAARACERMLLRAAESGEDLLWILPDYDRVVERRKKLAEEASSLRLGCTVSTLDAWVEDAWALWGDGRLLVSAVQRKILMAAVLSDSSDGGSPLFPVSAGTLDLFCSTAKTAAAFDASAFAAAPSGGTLADAVPPAGGFDSVGAFDVEVPALAGTRLTLTQEKMLVVLRAYRAALDERGLVEPASAMKLLASQEERRWPFVVCEGFGGLSPEEALFFAALSERASVAFVEEAVAGSRFDAASALLGSLRRACELLGLSCEIEEVAEASSAFGPEVDSELAPASERACSAAASTHPLAHPELSALARALYDAEAVGSVEPQGRLRVLLPAGRYAEASLLVDAVESSDAQTALVVCVDPARMFEEVSEGFERRGFDVQVSFARSFGETDFGRVFANALDMAAESADVCPDTFLVSDYLLSELSEKGLRGVYALDERWRSRRSLSGADVASDMAEATERYAAPFAALVRAGSFERAFDLAEARYRALSSEDEAFKAEQLAAVACARRALEQLRLLERPSIADDLRGYLETARVAVRVRSSAEGDCGGRLVCIMPYREAAARPAGSYDAVFACDMNAESQPVRLRRNSADVLFEAFGFDRDVLFESRLTFLRVLASARDSFYLLRRLNDADAAPLYPSIAFEEVMACYPGEPDKATAVASSLLSVADGEFVSHRGEELLMRNALLLPNDPPRRTIEAGAFDVVSAGFQEKLMDPVRLLSPSAIEDYLDCPHKWFARRRLRLASVDAGFSALEKGSFAHEVLKRFYPRYAVSFGSPKPRIEEDLAARAVPLLREVFAETLAEQPGKDPSDNPLIALSQSEKAQVEELLRHLEGFLARDAALLPAFEPRYFEYSFGRGEDVFEYAGMPLCGSIDRIDVDAQGRAVIVDYKSSLGDAYQLLPPDAAGFEELPAKVQTLIYAQVARRKLGLEMAGALYVHVFKPGSQPPVCGAYDDGLLGPDDLPGLRLSRNALSAAGCASFGELLDRVEDLVAERLAGLRAGCIRVDPRTEAACAFCPVLSCEGRK